MNGLDSNSRVESLTIYIGNSRTQKLILLISLFPKTFPFKSIGKRDMNRNRNIFVSTGEIYLEEQIVNKTKCKEIVVGDDRKRLVTL